MNIVLKQESYQVKNGFAAFGRDIGLTTHGATQAIAKENLRSTAVMFLRPFQREGKLEEFLQKKHMKVQEPEKPDLEITVIE